MQNLSYVNDRIGRACDRSGRDPSSVELIAVSKTFSVQLIKDAFEARQCQFGESRLQEAEGKIAALPESVSWHYIGRVQRNKARRLVQCFDLIHSIDSSKLAFFVDKIASEIGLSPKVLLQVNIGAEPSKGGYLPHDIESGMEELLGLARLSIQGLMCIPPQGAHAECARVWYVALRTLRDSLEAEFGSKLPILSMGMSEDFEVAIEEGATHVRVGSAIFGKRP